MSSDAEGRENPRTPPRVKNPARAEQEHRAGRGFGNGRLVLYAHIEEVDAESGLPSFSVTVKIQRITVYRAIKSGYRCARQIGNHRSAIRATGCKR